MPEVDEHALCDLAMVTSTTLPCKPEQRRQHVTKIQAYTL